MFSDTAVTVSTLLWICIAAKQFQTHTSKSRQPEQMDKPPLAGGPLGWLCIAWGKTSSRILSEAKNRMKGRVLCPALLEGSGGKVHTGLSGSEPRSPCACWVYSGGAVIEVRRGYISILKKHSRGWTVLELQWLSKRAVIGWKCQHRKGCSLWNLLSFLSFPSRGSLTERLPHACRFSPRILAAAEECYKLPTPPPQENTVTLHSQKLSCHWLLGKWRSQVIYLPSWHLWATVIQRLFFTSKRAQYKGYS